MITKTRLLAATAATAVALLAGGTAQARSSSAVPLAPTGPVTVGLPLAGGTQKVAVTVSSTAGITAVALDPSSRFSVVKTLAKRAVYTASTPPSKLEVKLDKRSLETKLTVRTLADVVGAGSWSANLFGNGVVTVPFTVGQSNGRPTLALGALTVPASVTVTSSRTTTGPNQAEAKVVVTSNGVTAKVSVKVHTSRIGAPARVSVDVELGRANGTPKSADNGKGHGADDRGNHNAGDDRGRGRGNDG